MITRAIPLLLNSNDQNSTVSLFGVAHTEQVTVESRFFITIFFFIAGVVSHSNSIHDLGGDYSLESVNLMHEMLMQLRGDANQIVKVPHYFVHSAGTGIIYVY